MIMKKALFFCAIIGFILVSQTGCDVIYGILQKEGAQEKKLLGELLPATPNEKVKEVQQFLSIYGYKTGKADGLMGQKTRDALEAFQIDHGLRPSRFVDKKTWEKLYFISEVGLVEKGEINYKTVQIILKSSGFDPGKIDGKLGPRTVSAIREFQEANGLKSDGVIGPATLRTLIDYLPARPS